MLDWKKIESPLGALVGVAFVGFLMWSEARSQQPPPNDHAQPAQSEQQRSPGQQITQSPPNSVGQPEAAQNQTAAQQQHGPWYRVFTEHPAEWVTAIFTVMLAIYTRGLFKATKGLQTATVGLVKFAEEQSKDMKASVAAAEDAAKAAQHSADIAEEAFRRLERPYLLIKITDTSMLRHQGSYAHPSLEYRLVNYGKLPAILRSVSVGVQNDPTFPLTTTQAIEETRYEVIPPDGEMLNPRSAVVSGSVVGQRFDGASATLLILHGVIQYEDPTGAFHTDSFMMRGLPGGTAFTVEGGEQYNWHKTEYPERNEPGRA